MKRYMLHPGYVVSKKDGDRHYITAKMLMKLYNVPPKDCVTYIPFRRCTYDQDKLIDLYPLASGKYVVPPIKDMQKQEEE